MQDRRSGYSILHISAPAEAGGLERVVQFLAIGQHRKGHRVRVVAVIDPRGDEHPFVARLREAGVETIPLELPPRAYHRERRAVRRICRKFGPDVVHTHGYRTDVMNVGVVRRLGIPVVTTEHGSSRLGGKARLQVALQMLSLRRFDAVIAVSRPIAQRLRGTYVPAKKLHLIRNAWSGALPKLDRKAARRALGLPDDGFVAGWVGRLIPVKGCDVFLRAIGELADQRIKASVIGDGFESESLLALTSSLGLNGRVYFHGARDDAADYYRAFDLFVLSSRTEGTPIVLFEAIAAGVPVVATRVGGVPDVVSDEEALLVSPENPSDLACAIESVYREADRAADRAQAARRRLQAEFNLEDWIDRYDSVYQLVTGGVPVGAET